MTLTVERAPFPPTSSGCFNLSVGLLEASEHRCECPHKRRASYWSVRVGDRVAREAVWEFRTSLPPRYYPPAAIFNERVDLELDGVLSGRPSTRIVERGRESGLVR